MSSPSPSSASATTRRGERTAGRILDAAESTFAARGFAGATLRDIADAVGVREPSLYNHFAGKEALYRAVLTRAFAPLVEALDGLLEVGASADDMTRLPELMTEILAQHPNIARLLLHELLGGSEHLAPALRDSLAPVIARSLGVLQQRGGAKGDPRDDTLLRVIAMHNVVVGYFVSGPLFELLGGGDLLAPEIRKQHLHVVRRVARALVDTSPGPPASGANPESP